MCTTQYLRKSATAATVAATLDRYRYRYLQLVNTYPNVCTKDGYLYRYLQLVNTYPNLRHPASIQTCNSCNSYTSVRVGVRDITYETCTSAF